MLFYIFLLYRMAFGELADDEYQSDLGATRGNIGKGGVAGGGIRMAQVMLYVFDVYCGCTMINVV